MTIEEFIARHEMQEVNQGEHWLPEVFCPEDDENHDLRVYVNKANTIGIAVNHTRREFRVSYSELTIATSEWTPMADNYISEPVIH